MNEQYNCVVNENYYSNPIIMGNMADPTILKDGDDYYMTNSSCGEQDRLMGMWHSTDLVNWELLYYVFEGCYFEEFGKNLSNAWAPELVKVDGIYYIYNYAKSFGNWVTTCTDIKKGNWTKPIAFKGLQGIDPGHVIDNDGNRYLCMSRNKIYPLSKDGLEIVGEPIKLCDDWCMPDEYDIEGICTESPKFYKKGEYYYFITAQGGTVGPPTSHCAVSYRTKDLFGEYELSPYNPIIHTDKRSDPWWSTGHASLVDAPNGKTYILYHGIKNAHRYMGRQTLMMPVEWTDDGWFKVPKGDGEIQLKPISTEFKAQKQKISTTPQDKEFGLLYNYHNQDVRNRIKFKDDYIEYKAKYDSPFNIETVSFMPQDYVYEYSVEIDVKNSSSNFAMGYVFSPSVNCGISIVNNKIQVFKHEQYEFAQDIVEINTDIDTVILKMRCNHGTVSYYYQLGNNKMIKLPHAYDIADWSSNISRGFSAVLPSLWSYGEGFVRIKNIQYTKTV